MSIYKIGVIGCGTMGSGIAQVCSQGGYFVYVYEPDKDLVKQGIAKIEDFLEKGKNKGKVTNEQKNDVLNRISGTTNLEIFSSCDLVIEAIPENFDLKKEILMKIDEICPSSTIFASNTSTLSIIDLANSTTRKDRFLGLHFFNPAQLMSLLELVKSIETDQEVVMNIKEFGESLGKNVIIAQDRPGFIVNYLQLPFRLNAIQMLESGLATPEEIDAAATMGLGHPMGPLALQDIVGLDVTLAAADNIYNATGDIRFKAPVLMQKMVSAGRLGRKSGQGFYKYS